MLNKLKKSDSKGFTIIEVMIVLAIAGLILLIVFLAVPALQRNSRNTQRKNDVGRVGSAATTVAANNNNVMTSITSANVQAEAGTLSYYQSTDVTAVTALATGGTQTNDTTVDTVKVVPNGKCSGVNAAYANRQIAVLYTTEAGTGSGTKICIDQ
jgi:prepilin-type N-terminal cleavage/methylation domain-containing protein